MSRPSWFWTDPGVLGVGGSAPDADARGRSPGPRRNWRRPRGRPDALHRRQRAMYRNHAGARKPNPLLRRPHSCDSPTEQLEEGSGTGEDDCNSTRSHQALPIPIRATRQVGKVLKLVSDAQIERSDCRFYLIRPAPAGVGGRGVGRRVWRGISRPPAVGVVAGAGARVRVEGPPAASSTAVPFLAVVGSGSSAPLMREAVPHGPMRSNAMSSLRSPIVMMACAPPAASRPGVSRSLLGSRVRR